MNRDRSRSSMPLWPKIDKTKQIANILRDIPPTSKVPHLKIERAMYADGQDSFTPESRRDLGPSLTFRPSPQEPSIWNDAKHREMMDRMSSSLQQCQHLLVSFRKKVAAKPVKLPPIRPAQEDIPAQASAPQAIWISAPAISSLFASLSQGDESSRGSISLSGWLKFCKDTDSFSKLKISKSDCARAFHLATAVSDAPGSENDCLNLEKFCQCLIFLAHLAGIFPGLGVDSLPLASSCDSHTSRCVSVLLLKLLANGIEADFDILSLSSRSQPAGPPSAQPSPRTARIATQGRGSTASTSSVAAQQVPSHAPSADGDVSPIWHLVPGLVPIFTAVAASDPGLLGAVGSRARSISMIEWLKFCKDYDAYVKLHLSKTECVRAFQLANSVGNSDSDSHEMDVEEFCQCILFLAKLAGFLGEGDNVPLASQCTVSVAESVSKLLTFLGCVVPEVGNRSSRNIARMNRQGSRGKLDAVAPSCSSAQVPPQRMHSAEGSKTTDFGSGSSAEAGAAQRVEAVDSPLSSIAYTAVPEAADEQGSAAAGRADDVSMLPSVPSGQSNAVANPASSEPDNSLNGNLEKAAISTLQNSFRDMNLLPEHKWFHFASCLAQAGVSNMLDLLHLGSDDGVLIKFLADTCGMNVIQGKKVLAFLKAT